MSTSYDQALSVFHDVAIAAATQKLGRSLREEEVQAVRRVDSLMFLESCIRGFESPTTPPEQVEEDLAWLVQRAGTR